MATSPTQLHEGLPLSVGLPEYNQETLKAMAEAKRIFSDPNIKGYTSIEELKAALERDD